MALRVRFTGKQQVDVESFELPSLSPADVRVASVCSLMSTGTENIVFNRLFEPGSHWDRWVKYPFHPGYATIGRVEDVGSQVATVKPGDLVAARQPHASAFVTDADRVFPVPAALDPTHAAWFALAKISGTGVMRAAFEIGERVLIIGAGPIGQMAIRWAVAMGAESVIAVDGVADRLALATRGGATAVIDRPIADATDAILDANDGQRPRVVIDSTGNPDVFAAALRIAADHGRVVLLGDTGTPTHQRLTGDVITRNVTVLGAHDNHPWPHHTHADVYRLFFRLAASGRFNLDGLNTHTIPGPNAPDAYSLANTRRGQTMGIVFDWALPQA